MPSVLPLIHAQGAARRAALALVIGAWLDRYGAPRLAAGKDWRVYG